ncbi:hypothetical protein M413DRAFT_80460 [Hebeloma cylindrosporum]|uniref:Uncharacterized protein n=1 Tax=Hebeloma cylindrosporum TaxID=76867 RepID=A0A0C3CXG9_HEBCY|nr:hypothetical protein M413DRAFT_80460 [Hebeloma cylindrosporum h7]
MFFRISSRGDLTTSNSSPLGVQVFSFSKRPDTYSSPPSPSANGERRMFSGSLKMCAGIAVSYRPRRRLHPLNSRQIFSEYLGIIKSPKIYQSIPNGMSPSHRPLLPRTA